MAHIRVTTFKNSVLATIISFCASMVMLFGSMLAAAGIVEMFDNGFSRDGISGILCGLCIVALSIGIMVVAHKVSENAAFKAWVRQIKGLEPAIRASVDVAVKVYMTYPCPRTLHFISKLNPMAGPLIQAQEEARRRKSLELAEAMKTMWKCPECGQMNAEKTAVCTKCFTLK